MGVAFSFASFSCTVGVIGPILAHGSSDFGHAAGGMLAYSLGFALPFFLLALFPATVSSMPRSGSWMNTMKVMLGFVELCFAGYYLWRMDLGLGWGIGTWDIVLALWTVTAFVAGLYLLGKVRLPKDDPVEIVTVPRAVGAIVVLLFALYLLGGFLGRVRFPGWLNGLLPPKTAVLTANGGDSDQVPVAPKPGFADAEFHPSPYNGLWWTTDYDHALEIAKKTGRRVLLNFTGIYCTNCRQVETGPFLANGEVRAELEKMVLVELWTDITSRAAEKGNWDLHHTTMEKSARYRDFRTEEFGTTANPYYVVLGPDGKRLAEMGYPTEGDSQLLAFLRTGE
jgi:thiol:disulfide interchange protein DsbD